MRCIDAHSHVWTPDTGHYPLAAGFRRALMKPPSFTPEELLVHARPVGVERVVLIQMSFYGYDNRYLLDAIRRQPDTFAGVAVIDQRQPRPEDEMRALRKQGVRGFRIYPKDLPPDRWLDGEGLQAMFQFGGAENVAMCCLIDAAALPALSRACEQHPDTPVVIDHLCGVGGTGTILPAEVQALCDMARYPRVTLKLSGFYALGRKQPPYHDLGDLIRRVYDAFGPDRLMWGTDCPFQIVEHTYQQSLDLVRTGLDFLTADDREWILRRTAERMFFD